MVSLCPLFFPRQQAGAHPLGNFSVNRYSRLELSQKILRIHYVVDIAEIPALQERGVIDTNQDGTVSNDENRLYLDAKTQTLQQGLVLTINDSPVTPKIVSKELAVPPGQGGLLTQRLEMVLEAKLPPISTGETWQIQYNDHNYADRLGWKEIIARPQEDVTLLESNVPARDRSNELRNYPEDLLYKPLEMKNARLRLAPGGEAAMVEGLKARRPAAATHAEDRFSRLITVQEVTLPVILAGLFIAMGFGAAHALSPGHGKTIVAAYLVGSRGTAKHAIFLGLTVTLTHTIGVFILGMITLFASRYILPEQLYPWLGTASGLIVLGIGVVLLIKRFRLLAQKNGHPHDHHHHDHEVEQPHPFSHEGTDHSHSHELKGHHHGHSHLNPEAEEMPVTWSSLLTLGISGGILPCPSALVILLGAISLNRVGFGILLIVAFSLGLAGVLTVIGLLFLKGKQVLSRYSVTGPLLRFLPTVSASVILILGLLITLNAVMQFYV